MKNQINFVRFLIALMLTVFVSNFSVAQTTASISTSVSTTAGSIDYSITGADMTAGYTIYYENAAPGATIGNIYYPGLSTPSDYITTDASGDASGTSTATFTTSGTYYAILVDAPPPSQPLFQLPQVASTTPSQEQALWVHIPSIMSPRTQQQPLEALTPPDLYYLKV
jgi:hypothetical protein